MEVHNPIVRDFYPDPSICEANGKYYLACISGVGWEQRGYTNDH